MLWNIGKHNTYPEQNDTAAWETSFGWVVCGAGKPANGRIHTISVKVREEFSIEKEESTIKRGIQSIWTLDHLGIAEDEPNDDQFLNNFKQTIERDSDGRYVAKLPFKQGEAKFDSCFPGRLSRLKGLLTELDEKPAIRKIYHEIFQE